MITTALALAVSLITGAAGADALLLDAEGRPGGGLAPLHFTQTQQTPSSIGFKFLTRDKSVVWLRLTRRDDGQAADVRLERYNVDIEVDPEAARSALKPAIDRVVERVKQRQRQGPDLRRARVDRPYAERQRSGEASEKTKAGVFRDTPEAQRFASLELWLCLALLLFALAGLPALFMGSSSSLGSGVVGPRGSSLYSWTLVAFLVVIGAQFVGVPRLLVTVFSGYASVAEALALNPVAKYGAATTALYGPLLRLMGPDTAVVTGVNVVVGLVTVLLAAIWVVRLADRPTLAPLAVLLIGLLPALMRDRASESVLVPMAMWVLAAWVHGDLWL
ncbi:MAG: hypothetical protein VX938_10730, partial [Myxococcota bacterium]|nr:hypothetical protein [Myxococcota bacterium]